MLYAYPDTPLRRFFKPVDASLYLMSDCARCDDDTRVKRDTGKQGVDYSRCIICGEPAVTVINGRPYCRRHVAMAMAGVVK